MFESHAHLGYSCIIIFRSPQSVAGTLLDFSVEGLPIREDDS